jgi:protein-S-isoprenylcysteine O-methyltransferase Ste14
MNQIDSIYYMIAEQAKDTPNVISYPPVVFLGALGMGCLLNWLLPLPAHVSESWHILARIISLGGTSLGCWGIYALRRAGTHVRPGLPVTTLVTDGPFRYSRNPLYVALTTIYVATIFYTGMWWLLVTLIPALAIVHWKIVLREEQYLENRFGENYRAYKARVRRWI